MISVHFGRQAQANRRRLHWNEHLLLIFKEYAASEAGLTVDEAMEELQRRACWQTTLTEGQIRGELNRLVEEGRLTRNAVDGEEEYHFALKGKYIADLSHHPRWRTGH